jgi:HlyD family secretion protein
MTRIVKRAAPIATLLGLAVVLGLLLRPGSVEVDLAQATRGPLRVTLDEDGETRVRERYTVTAPTAGRVARLTVREGDQVRRGDAVARIFPAPLDARARGEALARIAEAEDAARAAGADAVQGRAAVAQARRELGRIRELASRELVPPAELERAELTVVTQERLAESAEFRAQAAAHDVELARAALLGAARGALVLRAPAAAVVLRIPERSERVVPAGATLLELGNPAELEVVADLLSSDAVLVAPGAPVLIEGWGGTPLPGRIRLVEPSGFTKLSALGVEEQRVNVIADLDRVPPGLGDRFRIELRIIIWECADVLQVPASALFRQGSAWALYVIEAGRARLREVELGQRTPFEVEIRNGLAAGERVIRDPSDRIQAGTRVRTRAGTS